MRTASFVYLTNRGSYGYNILRHSERILQGRDIGMDTDNGINHGPFKYIIEYATDKDKTQWKTLIDASENEDDLCIDYRQFETVNAYGIKLKIVGAPKGITPGLVSLTAFGKCHKTK